MLAGYVKIKPLLLSFGNIAIFATFCWVRQQKRRCRYERVCVFGYNVTWSREDGTLVASNCLQSEPR